jgi:hypothetical protein
MNKMFNNIIRERLYGKRVNTIEPNELLLITSTWRRNDFQLYSGDHVTVIEINSNETEMVGYANKTRSIS